MILFPPIYLEIFEVGSKYLLRNCLSLHQLIPKISNESIYRRNVQAYGYVIQIASCMNIYLYYENAFCALEFWFLIRFGGDERAYALLRLRIIHFESLFFFVAMQCIYVLNNDHVLCVTTSSPIQNRYSQAHISHQMNASYMLYMRMCSLSVSRWSV